MTNKPALAGCPWDRIEHCPLYIASHEPYGLGCVDDMAGPCKIERGAISYSAAEQALIDRGLGISDVALRYCQAKGNA